MTPHANRPAPTPTDSPLDEPLELTHEAVLDQDPAFELPIWEPDSVEDKGAGGRAVLGWALSILAALWLGYAAWSAGRTLAGQALSSPAVAQWVAVATGPLALLGLVWLMFGRTRRRESERFTRSVIAMRNEAKSLDALLAVLSQRIGDSQSGLTAMVDQLMGLGDTATGKLDGLTREFDSSSQRLLAHGEALDRAANSARVDIGVLLSDLPQAETSARALSEQLRAIGSDSAEKAHAFGEQLGALGTRARETGRDLDEASRSLTERLAEVERAGGGATASVRDAEAGFASALDVLLDRTSQTLEQIRSGIDAQSLAIAALVDQSAAGIGRAGADSAEALAGHVGRADALLGNIATQVAEQETNSRRMLAEIDNGLAAIDQRFTLLAQSGDQRAAQFLDSLTRARAALDGIATETGQQDNLIAGLAERTEAVRAHIDGLAASAQAIRPDLDWVRGAAAEAHDKVGATAGHISSQQGDLRALLETLDSGVGDAQSKLSALTATLSQTQSDAALLTQQTAPALVGALLQVKDAAAHAAERAREAIEAIIPESAGKLSAKAREALEQAVQSAVLEQLRNVESVASNAVEAARGASDRLTQQMISIGQSAAALEAHIEQTQSDAREKDSEAFARRVALLMDSMNSAAIDVGKILSDEVDEKAWDSYLKGNRGVFTRRAVRLMSGSETRSLRAHYERDLEFQGAANRYIHDFEAMLRRILAERDGGMIAVTLMSSDMGKLYAALAQVIGR